MAESLPEEIARLIRESAANTTIGMAGWVQGVEGVEELANRLDVGEWDKATIQLIFRTQDGLRAAVMRLAEAIEEQNASR